MIHTDIGWNTQAIVMGVGRDGIDPATAAILVREFESCSECGAEIDPAAGDALREDRDAIWENDARYKSNAHECDNCGSELRIFVEEKAVAVISEDQLPDNADENQTLHFVPVENNDSYLQINDFHLKVSQATPRQSNSIQSDPTPVDN
jgi:DNA-directed RNA polymerase subunit RPC12/RpoP